MSNLKELLEELDMESWLNYEGIQHKLTRGTRGIQLNLRECPCCGNRKWKTYLNQESGAGNCFVCDEKFSKWKFIAAHLNVSNADVFNKIERYMQSQGWRPAEVAIAPVEETKLVLPDSCPLPINGKNLKYLEGRDVTPDLAKYFHLRYCHEGVFVYADAYGRPAVQDYSKRIIIPIFNEFGDMVSFQGRDITGTSEKRYLFPPGFASTGSVIYNSHKARGACLVMGEGVFDCIAIKAAMDEDKVFSQYRAIASFGKSLGFEQMEVLKYCRDNRGLKEVIFMWDSEPEAMSAAVDAANLCRSHNIVARIAILPPGRDPNEVAPEVVRKAIREAVVVTPLSAIRLKMIARKL